MCKKKISDFLLFLSETSKIFDSIYEKKKLFKTDIFIAKKINLKKIISTTVFGSLIFAEF
jgi:hypothetical protein